MGDGFSRSKDSTNSIKVLKEQIVQGVSKAYIMGVFRGGAAGARGPLQSPKIKNFFSLNSLIYRKGYIRIAPQ